jgi:hypothetical protein
VEETAFRPASARSLFSSRADFSPRKREMRRWKQSDRVGRRSVAQHAAARGVLGRVGNRPESRSRGPRQAPILCLLGWRRDGRRNSAAPTALVFVSRAYVYARRWQIDSEGTLFSGCESAMNSSITTNGGPSGKMARYWAPIPGPRPLIPAANSLQCRYLRVTHWSSIRCRGFFAKCLILREGERK